LDGLIVILRIAGITRRRRRIALRRRRSSRSQVAIGWIAIRSIRRLILGRLVLRRLILRFIASHQTHQKQSGNS
jgi:hypothetical protein